MIYDEVFIMNSIFFYNLFYFCEINFNKYHYTDNRAGSPNHYIAIMNKGRCKLVSENQTIEINEGDVFYIPLGIPYQSFWYGNNDITFKSLGFRFFPEANEKKFCLQKINCDESIKNKLNKITMNKTVTSDTLCDFFSILNQLLPLMQTENLSSNERICIKAKEYIYQNTECCAADIARHCRISESTLYLAFKTTLHKTPNEIKNEIMCEKAVFLLSTTNKTVQEISDTLCFSSTSYFRKALKRHIGLTPREIRKKYMF